VGPETEFLKMFNFMLSNPDLGFVGRNMSKKGSIQFSFLKLVGVNILQKIENSSGAVFSDTSNSTDSALGNSD
jgi:hypothetical protein